VDRWTGGVGSDSVDEWDQGFGVFFVFGPGCSEVFGQGIIFTAGKPP
jgi:hypothetical protein